MLGAFRILPCQGDPSLNLLNYFVENIKKSLSVSHSCPLCEKETRCPVCIDLSRSLWDQLPAFCSAALGDSNCWRGSNKYCVQLTLSIFLIIGTRKQGEYQTKVKTLIHYITENGLRYASGPVLPSNPLHK